jgi:predicted nucleic acid-binding protein
VIYLLDTNAISALMRADLQMASWLSSIRSDESRRDLHVDSRRDHVRIGAAGDPYASVKISQQRRSLPLDENDLWIAATTIAIDATLVSRDSKFQAVAGLTVVEP